MILNTGHKRNVLKCYRPLSWGWTSQWERQKSLTSVWSPTTTMLQFPHSVCFSVVTVNVCSCASVLESTKLKNKEHEELLFETLFHSWSFSCKNRWGQQYWPWWRPQTTTHRSNKYTAGPIDRKIACGVVLYCVILWFNTVQKLSVAFSWMCFCDSVRASLCCWLSAALWREVKRV